MEDIQVLAMLVIAVISSATNTGADPEQDCVLHHCADENFASGVCKKKLDLPSCTYDYPASIMDVFKCKIRGNDGDEFYLGIKCNVTKITTIIDFRKDNCSLAILVLKGECEKDPNSNENIPYPFKLNDVNCTCTALTLSNDECENRTKNYKCICPSNEIITTTSVTTPSENVTENTTFTSPSNVTTTLKTGTTKSSQNSSAKKLSTTTTRHTGFKTTSEIDTSFTSPSNVNTTLKTGTTISSLPFSVNTSANPTRHAQVNSNISVGLAAGLSVLSLFACLGVFALLALLWRRCHGSKSTSSDSTIGNTSSVESNEFGLIKLELPPRQNDYDQIVVDEFQNHLYTPISLKSNETSPIGFHATNQPEETITYHRKSIHQVYSQLGDVTRDKKTDYNQLPSYNISVRNSNSDTAQKVDGTAKYGDEAEKTNNSSVYFELEKSDEHKEDHFSTHKDTMIFPNSPKHVSFVSNLSQENAEAESNLKMPMDISSLNPLYKQVNCDPSTYFELEKQEEGIGDNTTDTNSMMTDSYAKLREVSRNIGSDYNELSALDKTPENENALSSNTVPAETIPSWSNYSLAQIPITTSDNDTTTVILSTGEDTLMTVN